MVLIIFIIIDLAVLCWSAKPLDYTPLLKYLDDDILRDITDPVNGRGHILEENIDKYNDRLGDTRDMIQQNVYEAYIKALELQKIGGPQFLKASLDKILLQKVHNWTEENFIRLQKQFDSTKEKWKEIEDEFEPAESRFRKIQEELAKEKAEMEEREQKRVEKLRKVEEEFNKKVTVNVGNVPPST